MVVGFAASLIFVLACWLGLRQTWGFGMTLLVASAVWLAVVMGWHWVAR